MSTLGAASCAQSVAGRPVSVSDCWRAYEGKAGRSVNQRKKTAEAQKRSGLRATHDKNGLKRTDCYTATCWQAGWRAQGDKKERGERRTHFYTAQALRELCDTGRPSGSQIEASRMLMVREARALPHIPLPALVPRRREKRCGHRTKARHH